MKQAVARRINITTLGCKVNQYESEAMRALFIANGDEVVDGLADIYVINTCTVTQMGDKKSRQMIRRAKRENPSAIVAVVGCYSQMKPTEVAQMHGVNLVIGTDQRAKIVELLEGVTSEDRAVYVGDIMTVKQFERLKIEQIDGKTRVFLKIQEGCNQYCSYCIIPYARGRIRSRPAPDIYREVARLVSHGYVEFVLTGIHLASYGRDLLGGQLIDVIEGIADIIGVKRIRLGSLEPTVISDDFMARLARIDQFCPQFHLSLQSGCDQTLKRMNRRYRTADFERAVQLIRRHYPDAAITTDIIVGFPGESAADFDACYQFVARIGFAEVHVFKYSPRRGTPAASMPDQVAAAVKAQRSERLMKLAEGMKRDYLKRFIGRRLDVLIETRQAADKASTGLTIYHSNVLLAAEQLPENSIVKCLISDCQNGSLIGKKV